MAAAAAGIAVLAPATPAQALGSTFAMNLRTDFGAVGNGTTDDTAAIQAAMNGIDGSAGGPAWGITGGYLEVPPGDYVLSDTIVLDQFAGVIQGTGVGNLPTYTNAANAAGAAAAFRWNGPAGKPMFRVTDSAHVTFRNLMFLGKDGAQPTAGIDFNSAGGSQGSNGELVVEDCFFGVYTWTQQATAAGMAVGHLDAGIAFTGANANNDQFRINRCTFSGRVSPKVSGTVGIRIDNTQSVWGSVTDCVFSSLGTGFRTSSNVTLVNPQFNRCNRDFDVLSTAKVQVLAYQSENAGQMARLSNNAGFRVTGGFCLINSALMPATSGALVDAFPSGSGQSIVIRDVTFGAVPTGASPRPTITFGPEAASLNACSGGGFLMKVEDCEGLYKDQAEFVGAMWASVPASRGIVEWTSRNSESADQFRNEMRHVNGTGFRTTLDRSVWDPVYI